MQVQGQPSLVERIAAGISPRDPDAPVPVKFGDKVLAKLRGASGAVRENTFDHLVKDGTITAAQRAHLDALHDVSPGAATVELANILGPKLSGHESVEHLAAASHTRYGDRLVHRMVTGLPASDGRHVRLGSFDPLVVGDDSNPIYHGAMIQRLMAEQDLSIAGQSQVANAGREIHFDPMPTFGSADSIVERVVAGGAEATSAAARAAAGTVARSTAEHVAAAAPAAAPVVERTAGRVVATAAKVAPEALLRSEAHVADALRLLTHLR